MKKKAPNTLRKGYTTGACATACSLAAAKLLFTGEAQSEVTISLPRGQRVQFSLLYCYCSDDIYKAGVIKDAGDDPDVTHGAEIFVQLRKRDKKSIVFLAGEGVGKITRSGLKLPVGEAAINPVPRQMIQQHLEEISSQYHYHGGFEVTVGVKNGEALAKKTMNARLGIVGGLSILGTTGIVKPFSCSAYIASIQQAVDVALVNGHAHLLAVTGNTSESAAKRYYNYPEMAVIEMGDFVGALLKHHSVNPISKLSLFLGQAKMVKLAMGALNLHSQFSQVDFTWLEQEAKKCGIDSAEIEMIKNVQSVAELFSQLKKPGALIRHLCKLAQEKAQSYVNYPVEIFAVDANGHIVGEVI